MACAHVKLKDGTSAIICGVKRQKKQLCHFCGSPSTRLCDWPDDKPVKIKHNELQASDVVVTVQARLHLPVQGLQRFLGTFRWDQSTGRITAAIDDYPRMPMVRHMATMYGLTFPKDRGSFLYYCLGNDKVTVLRPGTCDNPCCENCSREVGEDRDYCRAHWRSWELIA